MSTTICQPFKASNDVLGVGIRVNFYYTMLLLAVIPRTPHTEELLTSLYTYAGIAGFGLLLTAIIQTAINSLSLFEALFTLHILFFLGTGASPMSKYHWTRSRVAMGVLVQFVSVITFTVWGLYVWADVKHYGSHPECNDQIKYVFFFFTVRATAPWLRGLWITGIVLSAAGLMLSFGWKAITLFEMRRTTEEQQAEDNNTIAPREVTATVTRPHGETDTAEKPWYFDISLTLLFSAIYSTIMLELMVHRNKTSGVVQVDNKWEFGQVLAVMMILQNSNEFLNFLFGYLSRRKHSLARERQAQTEELALQTVGHSAPAFYRPRGPPASNVSARDQSTDKISSTSGYELQNLDKRNAEVSETTVVSNSQPQDHPIGTLR